MLEEKTNKPSSHENHLCLYPGLYTGIHAIYLAVICFIYTCDKFERGISEIFLPFQGVLKMYRIYRKENF